MEFLGYFDGPSELIKGMEKVRDAKYRQFDAFSPFPVHGLDDAQGLKRSPLPYITFLFGLTGTLCGFALQYWTSVIDWPLNVGGKPFNSWPAFVPVMFELTILFAGLSTLGGLLILNRMPNVSKKAFDAGLTRDKFAIWIGPSGKKNDAQKGYKPFNSEEVTDFLKGIGAKDVQKVYEEGWF